MNLCGAKERKDAHALDSLPESMYYEYNVCVRNVFPRASHSRGVCARGRGRPGGLCPAGVCETGKDIIEKFAVRAVLSGAFCAAGLFFLMPSRNWRLCICQTKMQLDCMGKLNR